MKKIGLLGGLSYISTQEYYGLINQYVREAFNNNSSAHIVIESLNEQRFLDLQADDPTEKRCSQMIIDAMAVLENTQADILAMSANGVHRFVDDLPKATQQKIVHIATETAKACERMGYKTVGLLGVYKTMTGDFYKKALADFDIDVIVPTEDDMTHIHQRITDDLCTGNFNQDNKDFFMKQSQQLLDNGADAVILGCTEIPLLLKDELADNPHLISTTHVHAKAIADKALVDKELG